MRAARTLAPLLVLATVGAARADLLVNGHFTGRDGGPSASGWKLNDRVEPNAYLGPNCVRGWTQDGDDGLLSQEVALCAGTLYRLRFDARSTQGEGSDNGIDVRLGTGLLATNSGLPTAWTAYVVEFAATDATVLSLVLRDRHSAVSLTNASLQAVPEPAALTALALGAATVLRRSLGGAPDRRTRAPDR